MHIHWGFRKSLLSQVFGGDENRGYHLLFDLYVPYICSASVRRGFPSLYEYLFFLLLILDAWGVLHIWVAD